MAPKDLSFGGVFLVFGALRNFVFVFGAAHDGSKSRSLTYQ